MAMISVLSGYAACSCWEKQHASKGTVSVSTWSSSMKPTSQLALMAGGLTHSRTFHSATFHSATFHSSR